MKPINPMTGLPYDSRTEACPNGCPITDEDSKTEGGRDICDTCGEIS